MRTMPKRLQKGDTVGIISPSSPPNLENLKKGFTVFGRIGIKSEDGQIRRSEKRLSCRNG